MTSIPDGPRDQLLFFFDNPLVVGEPGGKALISDFKSLVKSLLDDDGSSAGASQFAAFAASAPVEAEPSGDAGKSDAEPGSHEGAGVTLALGLLGTFAKGDLDI